MTRSLVLISLALLLVACADVSGPQPAAPVFEVSCTDSPEDPACNDPGHAMPSSYWTCMDLQTGHLTYWPYQDLYTDYRPDGNLCWHYSWQG
jgi:hypothetical protein